MPTGYARTLGEIKNRVRAAQYEAPKAVNRELVSLYWDIGRMIAQRQKEHGWGKSVVETLARDLQNEFPGMSGLSVQNLWYMRQFYLAYAGHPKLQPLVGEISWSKHLVIMGRCKDDLEREFYIRMTSKFGWTKNVLALRIQDQAYEKTYVEIPFIKQLKGMVGGTLKGTLMCPILRSGSPFGRSCSKIDCESP